MSQATTQKSSSTTAIVFAVFAVVSIVAFLAYRGSDVGQLPKLVGNLGGGQLFGNGSIDTLVGIVSAACILVSWAGLGSAVLKVIPQFEIDRLKLVVRIAIGAAIWSLVWFFLGVAGIYSGWIALTSSVIGLTLFFVFKGWQTRKPETRDNLTIILLVITGIVLLLATFDAIAPPIAKDTLLYHFAVPKAFIAQHSNAFIDGNIASYLALGTEMHSVWATLLGNIVSTRAGEAAAGATTFLFFPLLLLVIYGWAVKSVFQKRGR